MGLVLDSTVFIAAERRGLSARQTLADIGSRFPGEQFALSVITLVELAHGVARADTRERRAARLGYGVATGNLRHIQAISGLVVVSV